MSRRPPPDATEAADALAAATHAVGRAPPRDDDEKIRREHVRMIGEAAAILFADESPAALYVAGALSGWLALGGSLERDFLCVTKPKSRWTPSAIWHEFNRLHDEDESE